jgi:hypothetical protein
MKPRIGDSRPEWRFDGPDGSIAIQLKEMLQTNNGDALCAAAVAGGGIAVVPTFIAGSDMIAGRLAYPDIDAIPNPGNRDLRLVSARPASLRESAQLRGLSCATLWRATLLGRLDASCGTQEEAPNTSALIALAPERLVKNRCTSYSCAH